LFSLERIFWLTSDVFAKLNKLNIPMQGSDKDMLDVSDKIVAFIKKLSM